MADNHTAGIRQKINDQLSKPMELVSLLVRPYRFGFITGHSYLNDVQVASVNHLLTADASEKEKVTGTYEKELAGRIGPGQGVSFASARMALYTILETLGVTKGDEVVIPAFTCAAVPNAVLRKGATPVYTNISKETFGSDPDEIEKAITADTKLIIAQHTVGIPCAVEEIVEICRSRGIFLLEDSAQSLDSSVNNKKTGTFGNAAIFSSDHNKPLNTIIGGFLYTEDRELFTKIAEKQQKMPDLSPSHQQNLFRRFLFERDNYNPDRFGRALVLETFQRKYRKFLDRDATTLFLENDYCNPANCPEQKYPFPAKMPAALAQLGIFELEHWSGERERRKAILREYLSRAENLPVRSYLPSAYFDKRRDIVPLRFIFTHPDAEKLHIAMDRHLSVIERLYPKVLTSNTVEEMGYKPGSCPVSEKISARVINWPCSIAPGRETQVMEIFTDIFSKNS